MLVDWRSLSGDAHGAPIGRRLARKRARAESSCGVGGEQLQRTHSLETLFSVAKLIALVSSNWPATWKNLWRAYSILKQALRERRPNLLVLIDFP